MMNRIMEYEQKLSGMRAEFNALLRACTPEQTDEIARLKLNGLSGQIESLEKQVRALHALVEQRPAGAAAGMQPERGRDMRMPGYAAGMQPKREYRMYEPGRMPAGAGVWQGTGQPGWQQDAWPRQNNWTPGYQNVQQGRLNVQQERLDMEKTIGRSVMGICASVLIFISVIFFAALVLPYLSDTVKQLLMYSVGIGASLTGGLLLIRDKENKWFLSLTGCGMGVIYLSLFLSCFYFKSVGDLTLYAGLFLWAAVVCGLSRLRSQMFQVIGQIGIALSLLLGVCLCAAAQDAGKLLFLVLYGTASEGVYYAAHFRKAYHENLISHIFWCISIFLLAFGVCASYAKDTLPGAAAALVVAAAVILPVFAGMFFMQVEAEKSVSFGVFNLTSVCLLHIMATAWLGDAVILMALFAVGMFALLELRFSAGVHYGRTIVQCALLWILFFTVLQNAFFREYISVALFVPACLIYGYCRKHMVCQVAGLIYAILFLLIPMNGYALTAWGLILTLCAALLICRFRDQYRMWKKLAAYLLFQLFLIRSCVQITGELEMASTELRVLVTLTLCAAVSIAAQKIPALYRSLTTGQREDGFLTGAGVMHLLLMLASLACICLMEEPVCHLCAVLLGIILFSVNFGSLIGRGGEGFGLYAGIKYLALVLVILGSYSAPGYVISMAGLVLAVVCIVAGFLAGHVSGRDYKPVRVYGLALSLICVMKLILIDIPYRSMVSRAVSCFVSGVLCFGISFIYNMADRRFRQKNSG